MAIQYINTGSSANAGNGDSLRSAFVKVNNNFAYLSTATFGSGGNGYTGSQGDIGYTGSQGSAGSINDLSDVSVSSPQEGDYLKYNGTSWTQSAISIFDDPSPRLSTNLDTNGNTITSLNTDVAVRSVTGTNILLQGPVRIGAPVLGIDGSLYIVKNSYTTTFIDSTVFAQHHESPDVVNVTFYRTRGTSLLPTSVQPNDDIGDIDFVGQNATGRTSVGTITMSVDEVSINNTVTGKLKFDMRSINGQFLNRAELTSTGTWKIDKLGHLSTASSLVSISADLIPAEDLTYDLGSTSSQWRSLYVGTSTVYFGGSALSVANGKITLDGQDVNPFDQSLTTTGTPTFAGLTLSPLGSEGDDNVVLTNSGQMGPGLRITIPTLLGGEDNFYIDSSQGFPMIQWPDGTFQSTAMIGDRTAQNGQLYAEAATDYNGATIGGQYNLSSMTAINFGPDEVNLQLFNISPVATGTITGSVIGAVDYTITLTTGTISPSMTAWAVTPTEITTTRGTGRFHYLGEFLQEGFPAGTYIFSDVVATTEAFPAGTEVRFFDPDGTLYTPVDPLEIVWEVGGTTTVTGVIVIGPQIYNSDPIVVFVVGADATAKEFPILIQSQGYVESAATLVLDTDKEFKLESVNGDFVIDANTGPIVLRTGGSDLVFENDTLTAPGEVYGQYFSLRGGNLSGSIGQLGYSGDIPTLSGTDGVYIQTGDPEVGPLWKFGNEGRLSLGASLGAIYANQSTGMVSIADALGPIGQPTMPGNAIHIGGDDAFVISRANGSNNPTWTFKDNGSIRFPGGIGQINTTVSDGPGIQIESDIDFEIKITDSGSEDTAIWSFEIDGRIQFPDGSYQATAYTGNVVLETASPSPGTYPVGEATAITVTNSPNINWTNGTGVFANGINFIVAVDGSGNATVSTINDGGTGHFVGETFGPVIGTAFGGTSPTDDMYFEVTAIATDTLTALDLTKQVQILDATGTNGVYSLADGVEGQIMYFVPASTVGTHAAYIYVANARILNSSTSEVLNETNYSWAPFNAGGEQPRAISMAIFADGAWVLQGGVTD